MKNPKWLIAAIAALVVIAIVLLAVIIGFKPDKGENTPSGPNETQQQEPTEQEVTLDVEFGVVDGSVFDDETMPNEKSTEPGETTEPSATEPSEPTETSEPEATESTSAPETKPVQPTQGADEPEEPEQPTEPKEEMTYEIFRNLTPAQQRAYQESFESIEAFFEWYNAAVAAYEAANPPIVVGPGDIVDLNKIPGN